MVKPLNLENITEEQEIIPDSIDYMRQLQYITQSPKIYMMGNGKCFDWEIEKHNYEPKKK